VNARAGARTVRPHRLASDVRPTDVALHVDLDPRKGDDYAGEVEIALVLDAPRKTIELHADDLKVSHARVTAGGRTLRGKIVRRPEYETIRVELPERLAAGEATLSLHFAGKLRSDLRGLYGSRSGKRRYAFTQLEATDARRFFPCFAAPPFKARFTISVTTSQKNAVLSNAPAARTRKIARGRKTVRFRRTPPLSTYLVALAVGELEASKAVKLGDTPIRVWHVPGKRTLTAFALECARETLQRLEAWFDLPYPYEKLDLVAVPDFEAGAMENAGAVFFRETLLLVDPKTVSLAEKKRVAEVICHELAHMWYGDLVTMAWWDDLWLNESFATWMAFTIVDAWKPEWKMWHDFQHGRAAAMELDALRNTHPIYCEVKTPAEAAENFDLITYEKGAAVVRMLERYLGAEPFREGVRAYVRRHREKNAVAADLWRALSEASGIKVGPVARAWIEQGGYPVVELRRASRRRGRPALLLRQDRFTERPGRPARSRRPGPTWPVPFVGRVLPAGGGPPRDVRHLLTGATARVELPEDAETAAVYGNADEGGFFRPLHGEEELPALLRALPALSSLERMGLVDHQWALVRAGRADCGAFLDLVRAFAEEADPDVLGALRRPLAFLADSLAPEAAPGCEEPLRAFVREVFGPAFEAAGFGPAPDEGEDERLRRAALLSLVAGVGAAPELRAEASRRGRRYLDDRASLDPNLADTVVSLAAREGDARLFERFEREVERAHTPQEKRRFLLALGDFRTREEVERALALSLTEKVPTQDVVFLLVRLFANPAARERTWSFVKRRWPRLSRRIPSLGASRLIEATPALLRAHYRDEVRAFFREHPVPSGERALRQAVERFDWYRDFRALAAPALARRLEPAPARARKPARGARRR